MNFLENLYRAVVPVNVRTFAETALGNRQPITEKDFSPEELQAVRDTVNKAKTRNVLTEIDLLDQNKKPKDVYKIRPDREYGDTVNGAMQMRDIPFEEWKANLQNKLQTFQNTRDRTSFSYGDYPIKSGETAAPVNQGWLSALMQSYSDPAFRMASTLGSAKYHENNGKPYIEDSYGFSTDHPIYKQNENSSIGNILRDYGTSPGSLGEILFSKYIGNVRRPVKINLNP